MVQPLLKNGGGVAHDPVELAERQIVRVALAELFGPERRIAELFWVAGLAAGEGEPLDDVGREHAVVEREILGRGRTMVARCGGCSLSVAHWSKPA